MPAGCAALLRPAKSQWQDAQQQRCGVECLHQNVSVEAQHANVSCVAAQLLAFNMLTAGL